MNCTAPPELSDAQLWTYVDGESSPPVLAHLARCQHCYARAMQLARLSGRLKLNLYRLPCPTPIELGDYHLGMLDPVQAERIARHLDDCPLCSAEIARLSSYIEQLAPEIEGTLLTRARVLIATIVAGGGAARLPGFAPAFAGLRGGDDEPAIYQAEDIRVALDVQPELEQPDRRTLLGLVTGAESYRLSARLQQMGRAVATVQVDAIGNFVIADLAPDTYDLILSDPHVEIHILDLRV